MIDTIEIWISMAKVFSISLQALDNFKKWFELPDQPPLSCSQIDYISSLFDSKNG